MNEVRSTPSQGPNAGFPLYAFDILDKPTNHQGGTP